MLNMGVLGNSFYSFQKNDSHGTQFIWVQSDYFSSYINLPLSYTSLLKYAIGHFKMLVRPYHSDILDISRLYNLRQLTSKLMNSKWGPIKDCRWHFCAPFAGDFSSHPVLVMWPNGVNTPLLGTKGSCNYGKCWWTKSYRYHSLSCLSFTHQAFTRISREIHPVDLSSKMIKIWVNRHIVFNMKSGESRKSKSMNHHIISVVILNPMTNNNPPNSHFLIALTSLHQNGTSRNEGGFIRYKALLFGGFGVQSRLLLPHHWPSIKHKCWVVTSLVCLRSLH